MFIAYKGLIDAQHKVHHGCTPILRGTNQPANRNAGTRLVVQNNGQQGSGHLDAIDVVDPADIVPNDSLVGSEEDRLDGFRMIRFNGFAQGRLEIR